MSTEFLKIVFFMLAKECFNKKFIGSVRLCRVRCSSGASSRAGIRVSYPTQVIFLGASIVYVYLFMKILGFVFITGNIFLKLIFPPP